MVLIDVVIKVFFYVESTKHVCVYVYIFNSHFNTQFILKGIII